MSITYKTETNAQQEILYLIGKIDENSNFKEIKLPQANQLMIDLQGIYHINSMGLKNWSIWVKNLPKYPGGIGLRNCPKVVVNQINILEGFLPSGATVESIEVPFFCDECKTESNYLAVRGKDYIEKTADQSEKILMQFIKKCEKCGSTAHADIIEMKHFKFLNRRNA